MKVVGTIGNDFLNGYLHTEVSQERQTKNKMKTTGKT